MDSFSKEKEPNLKKVVFIVDVLGFAQFVVFLTAFLPSTFYPAKFSRRPFEIQRREKRCLPNSPRLTSTSANLSYQLVPESQRPTQRHDDNQIFYQLVPAEKKGLTGIETGWVMGVLHLLVAVSVYIELKLLQIVSPKKQLIIGLVFSGFACIAFGFAYMIKDRVMFLAFQLIIRIFHGASLGATDVASFVLTNMKTPIQYLSTALAVLEGLLALSIVVGAPLGAYLLQAGAYQTPFIVVGGFSLLYAIFVFSAIEETEYTESTGVMFAVKNTVTLRNLYSLYSFIIYGALLGFFASMLEPKLREFNLTLSQVGLVMMICNGVQAITFPISGQICDRTGKYSTISVLGYFIVIVSMVLFGPFPGLVDTFHNFSIFIASIVICAFGISALAVSAFVQCKVQLMKIGHNDTIAGSLASVSYLSFANIGIMAGDLLGGTFIDYLGYSYGSVVWAALMLFGIVFQFVTSYCNRTPPKEQSSYNVEQPLGN